MRSLTLSLPIIVTKLQSKLAGLTKPARSIPEPPVSPDDNPEEKAPHKSGEKATSLIITVGIMVSSTVLAWIFNKEISLFGADLMMRYGQNQVDFVLFLVTAVSCTPLVLPVWGYALVGMTLGYDLLRLASVMALGSAVGSLVTFAVGRYFSNNAWVKRKFPAIRKHPWTHGKSKKYVTWVLFIGTASPIPCDVAYAACGAKRYPVLPFFLMMVAGRLVRYTYLGGLYGYLTGSL